MGLEYVYNEGVIHRDIKNANLLVNKNDVIKLTDFGVATRSVSVNPEVIDPQCFLPQLWTNFARFRKMCHTLASVSYVYSAELKCAGNFRP